MPATPYRRVIFCLTTAEGWNGRFGPIFFPKCIFYTYDGAKIKISPSFGGFYPPKNAMGREGKGNLRFVLLGITGNGNSRSPLLWRYEARWTGHHLTIGFGWNVFIATDESIGIKWSWAVKVRAGYNQIRGKFRIQNIDLKSLWISQHWEEQI